MKNLNRKILLLLLALAFVLIPALRAGDDDRYAAVAVSESNGQSGYGTNCATKEQCIAIAEKECGRSDSKTFWCRNAWIALAISDSKPGGYGWGWDVSKAVARSKAIQNCKKFNGDARITICVSAYGTD